MISGCNSNSPIAHSINFLGRLLQFFLGQGGDSMIDEYKIILTSLGQCFYGPNRHV